MGNGLNRHFSKEDVQLAKKHMKRCSTSLITCQGNANQNTVRYHLTPFRVATIERIENTSVGEDAEVGTLVHCW